MAAGSASQSHSVSKRVFRRLALAAFIMLLAVLMPARSWADTVSSLTGVTLGSGFTVRAYGMVDQTGMKAEALAAVRQVRQDALNDSSVRLFYDGRSLSVSEALSIAGISTESYLNPQWSNALERIAVQRLAETCNIDGSHVRTNGEDYTTASYHGESSCAELLDWGDSIEGKILHSWYSEKQDYVKYCNGESHGEWSDYAFLINPSYAAYGFAKTATDSVGSDIIVNSIVVAEAGYGTNDTSEFALSGTYDFPINVTTDAINQGVFFEAPGATIEGMDIPKTLNIGESYPVSAYLNYRENGLDIERWLYLGGDWTSSDPSVLTVTCNGTTADGTVTARSAGTATITVTTQGRSWTSAPIRVTQTITDADVPAVGTQSWTGSAITPSIRISIGGKTLAEGTDYTLSYENNIDPGTASVTITGAGSYTGTVTKSFAIKADLSQASMADIPDQDYCGKPLRPAVSITLGGRILVPGTDYSLAFSRNDAPGTATVTATGMGSYTGTCSASFQIKIASIHMYRLYNQWSGEHLFTTDKAEYDHLGNLGWNQEDVAWNAPSWSDAPVYRLYNRWSGDHFYTADKSEYERLGKIGWNQEGIAFYSAKKSGKAIYRLFNRWLTAGTHLFTTDEAEYDRLGDLGWDKEGIAFYALPD